MITTIKNYWRIIGVAVALWLMLSLVTLASFYFYNQSKDNARDISVNRIVCVTRKYIIPVRDNAIRASKDTTISESQRERARGQVVTNNDFLENLITIPRDFNCSQFTRKVIR